MNRLRTLMPVTNASALLAFALFLAAPSAAPAQESPIRLEPPSPLKLPAPQRFELGNGLRVVLMENHKVPLVEVEMLVRGGSASDPGDRTGLATMTAEMMEEGAGTRNSLEYADAVDFLGASVSAFASVHSSGVSLFTPLSKLDSAMALFADMVLRPAFPEQELERLRNERLTTLIQWHDQPRAIASAVFNETLYGENHAYGKTSIGDEASIRGILISDVRSLHERLYAPANATIIVVGDIGADQVRKLLGTHFGSWSGGRSDTQELAPAPQVSSREIVLVDKPGAAQSDLCIQPEVARFHPAELERVEEIVARLAPRPEVPPSIRKRSGRESLWFVTAARSFSPWRPG